MSSRKNTDWWYTSTYNVPSDFFSVPNLLDLFVTDNPDELFLPTIQYFLDSKTVDFIYELNNLTVDLGFRAAMCLSNLSQTNVLNDIAVSLNDLNPKYATAVSEIIKITSSKTEVDLLRAVFMEFHYEVGMFDVILTDENATLYQNLATPEVKLYYPEPFIASPSFVHEEVWFIHILHYQHWLWFMFITLIMFYFITFINVVRWCNMRTRPRRETRGVSRSKCADLITATVPVSWAASIIITESVDATDYYDGFGTGEMIVGIRAYQWGWEYFYPKGIDLNYNVTPSYSSVVGNSLKYTSTEAVTVKSNTLWKHYRDKTTSQLTSTPAHIILNFSDNSKIMNFFDLSNVGVDTAKDSAAFKKTQLYSKTNPHTLSTLSSDFQSRYNKIWNLYLSEADSTSSINYGTYRQHNFNPIKSSSNMWTTSLDRNCLDKLMCYNLGTSTPENRIGRGSYLNFVLANQLNKLTTSRMQDTLFNFPQILGYLNSYTDQKHPSNSLKYLLTDKVFSKKTKQNLLWLNNFHSIGNLLGSSPLLRNNSSVNIFDIKYDLVDLKSLNMQFLSTEKNLRPLNSLKVGKTNHNFDELGNSLTSLLLNSIGASATLNSKELFEASINNWVNPTSINRLVGANTSFAPVHPPLPSKKTNLRPTAFDRLFKDVIPEMLKSKEEVAPTYLFNTYWINRWGHTNPNHRYNTLVSNVAALQANYTPFISDYAEYDFMNWQALELLEDAFWETSYSSDAYYENVHNFNYALKPLEFQKYETVYNLVHRNREFKYNIGARPLVSLTEPYANVTGSTLFTEDGLPTTPLLSPKNYEVFNNELTFDTLDDSYENFKNTAVVYNKNYQNVLGLVTSTLSPTNYSYVMDMFRPDYEEKSTHFDTNLAYTNLVYTKSLDTFDTKNVTFLNLSNPFKLRSSSKNAIVTYNAMQKVFRARFDEGRSNARLQDFSQSGVLHPFITASKVPYENILGKNKNNFFDPALYNKSLINEFSDISQIINSLNIYLADLPFLVSMKSDASRYLWFDWQSRWSSIEHQPSSTARYSLLGVPYSTKNLEYETATGNIVNDSETYLLKLARARKNYLSTWAYTPYFYEKVTNWYKIGELTSVFFNLQPGLKDLKFLFKYCSFTWESQPKLNNTFITSTPTFSGLNTYNKSSWRPTTGVSSYYYNASILVDILSKREMLYRQYFLKQNYTSNLPKYFSAAPSNPLLQEIKSAYPFVNPTSFVYEDARESFYQNTTYLKFLVIKDFLYKTNHHLLNSPLNLSTLTDYLFFYLFGQDKVTTAGRNIDLYKNPARPMRKGVTNMIRLHATGAIAMPTETRMHILASSRDVIHSWAIPSAGIKIDCVPGYSSHRVTIFLVSGIFWGQCMEICGRFHHWMPIIVYFMKRDLFFLWCTHFMHYSQPDKVFHMCDRQLMDHVRLVSYDKTTWARELNNLL